MLGRRFVSIAAVLLIAVSLVPMAEAQGRGQSNPPTKFEWTAPDSAKSKNQTASLEKDGSGTATFRFGYRASQGGGGMNPAGWIRYCPAGTKMEFPLIVDPTTVLAPHMVSITPAKASFDVSTQVPSGAPSGGGQTYRWSENHKVSVHYDVGNLTAAMATLNITVGPATVTSGCQPAAPSPPSTPAKTFINWTVPAKAAAAPLAAPPAESPGLDFVSIALIGLVALVLVARRAKA